MASCEDSELRIVLLGKSGSGKSSTGNTILKEQKFQVDLSPQSVTKESKACYGKLGGRRVCVIDTPGPFNTHSYTTVKEQIEEAMNLAHPGVHVFLLVMKLGVRFSEEEKNTVKWILETLGKEAKKHTIVLFTHRNQLKGRTIEEHLQEHSVVKKIIGSVADNHVFENENEDDETQVTELLEKINKMMDKNEKNKMYTREIYSEVQRKKRVKYSVTVTVGAVVTGAAAAAVSGTLAWVAIGAVAAAAAAVVAGTAAGAAAMGVMALVKKDS